MSSGPELHVVPGAAPDPGSAPAPATLADRPDEDLMVASAAGHRDAFEVLVTRYAVTPVTGGAALSLSGRF